MRTGAVHAGASLGRGMGCMAPGIPMTHWCCALGRCTLGWYHTPSCDTDDHSKVQREDVGLSLLGVWSFHVDGGGGSLPSDGASITVRSRRNKFGARQAKFPVK